MGCNGFLHSFSEFVPWVPSVGDFDRIRRSGAGSFGIGAGAVTADDLGTGMCSQPFGDGAGCAIGENIHRTVSIHVDQNCAVPVSPAQREVIDTEHRHHTGWRVGQRSDQPERPTETPSVDANLDPARPANASAIFSMIPRSSGVVRE